jgi:hypothetical protein
MDGTPYAKEIGETTTTLPDKSERILVEKPTPAGNKLAIPNRNAATILGTTTLINTASL